MLEIMKVVQVIWVFSLLFTGVCIAGAVIMHNKNKDA